MFDGGKARLRLFFVAYSRVQSSPPVEEYPKGEVVFRISRLFIKDHPSGCYPAPLRRRRTLFSGITNRGGIGCGVNAQLKWDSGIPSSRGSAGSSFCECKNLRRRHLCFSLFYNEKSLTEQVFATLSLGPGLRRDDDSLELLGIYW